MKQQHSKPSWSPNGPDYKLLAQFGFVDLWVQDVPQRDPDFHTYGLTLDNTEANCFWFSTVRDLLDSLDDRWPGHMPEGFEDWITALVALREPA